MSRKVYVDSAGREVVQFHSPGGPKLELWASPWHLAPDEAFNLAQALLRWAVETADREATKDQ